MTDPTDDNPGGNSGETPLQRALRMKKAAQETRGGAPAAGKSQRPGTTGMPVGVSRPQMKRK